MASNAAITAVAKHTPERIVTTKEIAEAWNQGEIGDQLAEMLGVSERRVAGADEDGTTLALHASNDALARAGLEAGAIDFIIGMKSDRIHDIEASADSIKAGLGATRANTFEVKTNCRGFLDALRIAQALVDAKRAERILIAGGTKQTLAVQDVLRGQVPSIPAGLADVLGRGDAGAAVIVERKMESGGIRIVSTKSIEGDASELSESDASTARRTITGLTKLIRETLSDLSWTPDLVKWMVGPQFSANFTRLILERAGIPGERGQHSLKHFGITSVASIPLTLAQVLENPSWTKGQALLGAASPGFGAMVLALDLS